jgi:hypothetical protein
MYIQWFVKGIPSQDANGNAILERDGAFDLVRMGQGVLSNWWRDRVRITPSEIEIQLTPQNLDRHVHDYDSFGPMTPFISVASGCVERDLQEGRNNIYSARDTALEFATRHFSHAGTLIIGWLPVALNPAVEISGVAEAIRDLNVYHRWSPYQIEGEITAKINIPANQIASVEWWDPAVSETRPADTHINARFATPAPMLNHRDYF